MIRQIKCMCLLFALVVSPSLLSAQGSLSPREQQYIDSIRRVLSNDYAWQLDRYRQISEQEAASNRSTIDSLQSIIADMKQEISELSRENKVTRSEVRSLQLAVEEHAALLVTEKQKFTRLLWVAGPSLLALILMSTVLFFLMLRRQQESSDRKINALKKYTYTEIEETRTDLIRQFRKRVKKLRTGMKLKNEEKKGKKEGKKNQQRKIKKKKSGK